MDIFSLQPATVLRGRYTIEQELGRGGIGVVYLARDAKFARRVVVKLLLETAAHNEWLKDKFQHEREALGRLQHPNIVGVLDADETPHGHPFLVMDYVKGVTLRSQIDNGPIAAGRVAHLVRQMGRALTAVHREGIYHRDLKPENIMLQRLDDDDELVKIIDFGIAKLRNPLFAPSTESLLPAGTALYMSPEQLVGDDVNEAADIYALGIVAYEMLAGQRPFNPSSPYQLLELQRAGLDAAPHTFPTALPPAAYHVLRRALSYDASQRPSRARDFGDELAHALTSDAFWGLQTMPMDAGPLTADAHASSSTAEPTRTETAGVRVALLYKRNAPDDERLLHLLETSLRSESYSIFIDRHLTIGVDWAREIERQIRAADAVIVLLSESSMTSEMLAYEVQMAHEAAQQNKGKPRLLPVRVNYEGPLPEPLQGILSPLQYALWTAEADDARLVKELLTALAKPAAPPQVHVPQALPHNLETPGGAVPLSSVYYVKRPTDAAFAEALRRRDSIVLVKGARQMGKTSLLARGLQQARKAGAEVVITDLQKLNQANLEDITSFFKAVGEIMADQLELDVYPEDVWKDKSAPSVNFERYLRREVLKKLDAPLVWGLDEVDRLFTCSFGSEVFGLFRSWHNERAMNPEGPWERLTLAIVYATEAHLFITDQNQSPFNVGTRLELADFTFDQTASLNELHGAPLRDGSELARFQRLVNGHPYLTRRGLHDMTASNLSLNEFERLADSDEGPYGDHLRRILVLLARDTELCDIVRGILRGQPARTPESFYRLRSAGLMSGDSARNVRPRCQLYANYLERHLL